MKLEELDESFMFGKSAKEDLLKKVQRLAQMVKDRTEQLDAAHTKISELEAQLDRIVPELRQRERQRESA